MKVLSELRIYVFFLFVSFAIYLNALDGPFLHDDIKAIVENKDVLVGFLITKYFILLAFSKDSFKLFWYVVFMLYWIFIKTVSLDLNPS